MTRGAWNTIGIALGTLLGGLEAQAWAAGPAAKIAILRTLNSDPGLQQRLALYGLPGNGASTLGPILASDESFHGQAGKSPTRFVFAGDANGDGVDEVFEARTKTSDASGQLTLRSTAAPTLYLGSLGPVIGSAKKGTLGTTIAQPCILALGAGDADDDGRDDALIAIVDATGQLTIEVRKLPKKKDGSMSVVKASLGGLGNATADTILALTGVDFDGDDADEIALLRRSGGSLFSLEVYSAPSTLGEIPTLRGSYVGIDALSLGIPATLARIQNDGDERDEVLIGFRLGAALQRVTIHDLPLAVGLSFPTALFEDVTLFSATEPATAAFALRGHALALPPANLSGAWKAHVEHVAGSAPEAIDVTSGMQASQTGSLIQLLLPVFNIAQANYNQNSAALAFLTTQVQFTAPSTGAKYVFTFDPGSVVAGSDGTYITGAYSGKKHLPLGQEVAVTAGKYRFFVPD